MTAARSLYFEAIQAGEGKIDRDMLELALAECQAELTGYFDVLWSELDRSRERLVAQRLARGDNLTDGIPSELASSALKALVDRGVIVRTGHGKYRFVEPLFDATFGRCDQAHQT